MQRVRKLCYGLLVWIGSMCLFGCNSGTGDAPELVEATGIVAFEGKPVVGGEIRFVSNQRGLLSIGGTDAEGRFRMIYKRGVYGAAIDTHVVTITRGEPTEELKPTAVPKKYGSRETSGLTATVTESGPNDFAFDLTSD